MRQRFEAIEIRNLGNNHAEITIITQPGLNSFKFECDDGDLAALIDALFNVPDPEAIKELKALMSNENLKNFYTGKILVCKANEEIIWKEEGKGSNDEHEML